MMGTEVKNREGSCDDLVLAGTGVLLMYQAPVGRGRDPVTEQFRSTWSPGEREIGTG